MAANVIYVGYHPSEFNVPIVLTPIYLCHGGAPFCLPFYSYSIGSNHAILHSLVKLLRKHVY